MNEAEFQELVAYQNLLARRAVQEANQDRKIRFLQLATRLSVNGKKKVQTEALLHAAEAQGFSDSEAYRLLEELERDGIFVDAGPGYVKRA